jgi:arylsulfatase A-like enzyme
MQANKTKPFLAYLSFYSVHTPLMARDDLQRKYEARRQGRNLETKWGQEGPRKVRLTQDHAIYAGMVEAMDQAAGKVLAKLDELGLAENTIVIFTSDNGGLSTSEGSPTSNQPLRAGKGWLYEGGIRVPLLMRWPGVTKASSTIDVPVSSPDFLATFLKASGTPLPQNQPLDGIDLKPILQGAKAPERALFWHYPHYGNQGSAPGAAIRRGDWKLIEWFEDNSVELFNLANDGSEKQNLAAQEKERVQTLRAQLHDWQKQVGARMPMPNPKYDTTKPNGRRAAQQN